jgi:hypothetical protein
LASRSARWMTRLKACAGCETLYELGAVLSRTLLRIG